MIPFVDIKPLEIIEKMVADFEKAYGETLLPGDERYIFLQQLSQIIVGLKALINTTANSNLLRYAIGEVLDEYGSQYDVSRLPAKKAVTNIKFTLSSVLAYDVIIQKGTRVTPDGKLNFLTDKDTSIPLGQNTVTVRSVAEMAGTQYNGFLQGQIKSIVDPIPYIASAENVDISYGGAEIETDDSYRERIRTSWTKTSTAGSREAYEYFVRATSADISDVAISSVNAGEVNIYVLSHDGEPPTELLKAIKSNVSADKCRPLTDLVNVLPATAKNYDISLTYYISKSDVSNESVIKKDVEQAILEFANKQKQILGGSINPDTLRNAVLNAGGYRIDIATPIFTSLLENEYAVMQNSTAIYGGIL